MKKTSALISVNGLTKSFSGSTAVAGVALQVHRGDICGFVGPNGSGKTTTLRMLAGVLTMDAGDGTVLGYDLRREATKIRSEIGYMTQRLALHQNLTVAENLQFRCSLYALSERRNVLENTLDMFGLRDVRNNPVSTLSGGWMRRVQLAATLIHQPHLIFLDEPTAGMDGPLREQVWRHIARLAHNGAGIVINTHDLSEAERCTGISVFHRGHIIQAGSPMALIDSSCISVFKISGSQVGQLLEMADTGALAVVPMGADVQVVLANVSRAAFLQMATARHWTISELPTRLEHAIMAYGSRVAHA